MTGQGYHRGMDVWDDPEFKALDPGLQGRLRAVFEGPEPRQTSAELLDELHRIQEQAAQEAEANGLTYEGAVEAVQRALHPGRLVSADS